MRGTYGKLKRAMAMLLSILMLMSVLPVSALAEGEEPQETVPAVAAAGEDRGDETEAQTDADETSASDTASETAEEGGEGSDPEGEPEASVQNASAASDDADPNGPDAAPAPDDAEQPGPDAFAQAEQATPAPAPVPKPEYIFPQAQVKLADVLDAVKMDLGDSYELELSVDSDAVRLSHTVLKDSNLDDVTLTALRPFAYAVLTLRDDRAEHTISLGCPEAEAMPVAAPESFVEPEATPGASDTPEATPEASVEPETAPESFDAPEAAPDPVPETEDPSVGEAGPAAELPAVVTITATDGVSYLITVTYDDTVGIPMAGTALQVEEVMPGTPVYQELLRQALDVLGTTEESMQFMRFFDITIVDAEDPTLTYEPTGFVDVSIQLMDAQLQSCPEVDVLHFDEAPSVMDSTVSGASVDFSSDGFSLYGVAGYRIEKLIEASDGNTYRITVTYDSAAGIPLEGTELLVSEVMPDTSAYDFYLNESIRAMGTDADHIGLSRAFDIRIVSAADASVVYEPQSRVSVSITLVGATLTDYVDVHVLHFEADDAVTALEADLFEDTVTFTTDSFSVYSVSGTVRVRTYYFYTYNEYTDYEPYYLNTDTDLQIYYQIVREGESPVAPQKPVNPQDQEASFAGWFEGDPNYADPHLADDPYVFSPFIYDPAANNGEGNDGPLYLYARFSHFAYVVFHDQYDEESGTYPIAFTRRVDLYSADLYVDLDDYSVSYEDPAQYDDNAMVFVGWSDAPIRTPGAALNDYGSAVEKVHTNSNNELMVYSTIHLYPIYQAVKWIGLYSGPAGSHATYFTDTYCLDGVVPVIGSGSPLPTSAVMTRDGNYDFAGWYANATLNAAGEVETETVTINGGSVTRPRGAVLIAAADGTLNTGASGDDLAAIVAAGITFENVAEEGEAPSYSIRLTKRYVDLYAYWTEKTTAKYTIVVVKQNATDSPGTADAQKTYSYSESFTLYGTIGSTVLTSSLTDHTALDNINSYNALHGTELGAADNPYAGYVWNAGNSDVSTTINAGGSATLYLRYDWTTQPSISARYALRFVDPMTSPEPYVIREYVLKEVDGHTVDDRVAYGTSLSDLVPADPLSTISAKGLSFHGWYADKECTTRAIFHAGTTAEDLTDEEKESLAVKENGVVTGYKPFVFFSAMPAADMTFYAGWTRQWFLIKIDTNYGELYSHLYTDAAQTEYEMEGEAPDQTPKFMGTGSTWMWKEYGDTFQEYVTVKRDYVESDSGSWYYVRHDRAYHGYPDTWLENESQERKTYYTKEITEATELTTFKYDPGVYRYAGWYEVYFDEAGNEIGEASERYDFTSKVDHDITLRLYWQKTGVFYLQYVPGLGSLNTDEELEKLYLELDGDSYSDDAEVVVARVALAPEGYEFVGWKIRGDESGTVYRPGETIRLLSQFMATAQGKRTMFLEAVYERASRVTLVYHANGGAAASGVTQNDLDYGSYPAGSDEDNRTLGKTAVLSGEDITATVTQLVNNSQFTLSNALWLTGGQQKTFVGWCERPQFDPLDTEHPLLDAGATYRIAVDEDKPQVDLYAIWMVDVRYHLNQSPADASFGGDWNDDPNLVAQGIQPYVPTGTNATDTYTQTGVHIGSNLSWPAHDPVWNSSSENPARLFLYWATRTGDGDSVPYAYTQYDFSQAVTGPLDLYAVWDTGFDISISLLDSTAATIVDSTLAWTGHATRTVRLPAGGLTPAQIQTQQLTGDIPSDYVFAFATHQSNEWSIQDVEENPIKKLYYKARDQKLHLVYEGATAAYADDVDTALGSEDTVYFVFYQQIASLPIRYKGVDLTGYLTSSNADVISYLGGMYITVAGDPSMVSGAPAALAPSGGVFDMSAALPAPMTLLDSGNTVAYGFYSFAISTDTWRDLDGDDVIDSDPYPAINAVDLSMMSEQKDRDAAAPPSLQLRQTWRGFEYSRDGVDWNRSENAPVLYVIYYTELPTVVTFRPQVTAGLEADDRQTFQFDYWIEELELTNGVVTNVVPGFDSRAYGRTLTLMNGEPYSAFLFTSADHAYRVTIAQRTNENFSTTVFGSEAVHAAAYTAANTTYGDYSAVYSYASLQDAAHPDVGGKHMVSFDSARVSVDVEISLARVNVKTGTLRNRDEWRSANTHTVRVPLGTPVTLNTDSSVPSSGFLDPAIASLIDDNGMANYAWGAVIHGCDKYVDENSGDEDRVITPSRAPTSCNALALEPRDTGGAVYSIYLRNDAGQRFELPELSKQQVLAATPGENMYRIYYLYYPMLTIHYVVEDVHGDLSYVQGSLNGTDVVDTITYDGAELTMNGMTVTQRQSVYMPMEGLEVSQKIGTDAYGNAIFNIPPLLDNGTEKLELVYDTMGAKPQSDFSEKVSNIRYLQPEEGSSWDAEDESLLPKTGTTRTLILNMEIVDNRLKWKFKDEPVWVTIDDWPVVYAIYRERGYNLTVSKTVSVDTGYDEPFTVTIRSTAINRESYKVDGTGYSEIEATTASADTPGSIVLDSVKDGDEITIIGLLPGSYTVTETGNEGFTLTAKITVGDEDPVDQAIVDSAATIDVHDHTRLALTNAPQYICRVGTEKFYTLSSAVQYIADRSTNFTATIEMLQDYLIPASDIPEIPTYLHVTLTTAAPDALDPDNKIAAGVNAVITRKSNVAGSLFHNLGELTLGNITISGNGVSGSALIDNEGTLNLGGDISVVNVVTTEEVTTIEGVTTYSYPQTATPATVTNTDPVLIDAVGSGNGGAIYSLKGEVNVIGGTIGAEGHPNTAYNGAAIYAEGGTVSISGGTFRHNDATVSGGVIYYAGSGLVTVSGGTLGASGHPNSALNGGAIYMASGTANISDGAIAFNTATDGGAIYAENAYVNVSGGQIRDNTASDRGGAVVMETLTLTVSGGTIGGSGHANSAQNGGAIWSGTGSVAFSGGQISYNTASENGGGVYTQASTFQMTGGSLAGNSAGLDGGGAYAESGAITVANSASTISGNSAGQNGGGLYVCTGSAEVSGSAVLKLNTATGDGGALYVQQGTATLTGCVFGKSNSSSSSNDFANRAAKGAAVFVDEGSATFDGCTIWGNVATGTSGAVAVGTLDARLYFMNSTRVRENTMISGATSNVYLDKDSDTVITFTSVGGSADIGIYVSDDDVSTDADAPTVLEVRGVPSTTFGSYVNNISGNLNKIKNDRTANLKVGADSSSKRVYWYRNFTVEVYYTPSYESGLPFSPANYIVSANRARSSDGTPPSFENAISDVAEDVRSRGRIMPGTDSKGTAVFGQAYVKNNTSDFGQYLTEINWDTENNHWIFVKRDGNTIHGGSTTENQSTLYFIFTEPYYISIENNSLDTLVISDFKITVNGTPVDVVNSDSQVGYGYVFSVSDEIQDQLKPVTAGDLVLKKNNSIRILLPGAKGMSYTLTGSYYSTYVGEGSSENVAVTEGTVGYTQTGNMAADLSVTAAGFTLSGSKCKTPTSAGGTHELIFGGARSICKLVVPARITTATVTDDPVPGESDLYYITSGFVKQAAGSGVTAGKWEYTFSSPSQAESFILANVSSFITSDPGATPIVVDARIQMLEDYMFPAVEQVKLNSGGYNGIPVERHITFTTAKDGTFQYANIATEPRAKISRASGNQKSFIYAAAGDLGNVLRLEDLRFDGKNYGGSINGGIIQTKDWNVEIDNVDVCNCVANNGGGIYIDFTETNTAAILGDSNGRLTITNTRFDTCRSSASNRQGGGAVWTSAKTLTLTGCSFSNCSSIDQGGAVFHRIDTTKISNYKPHAYAKESYTIVSGCEFTSCESRTGGAVETDAHHVTFTDSTFTDCYAIKTTREGSGGAIATYIYEDGGKSWGTAYNTDLTVTGCTFIHCTSSVGTGTSGNGGAIRSHSMMTVISGCTFLDCRANYRGGAIAINNNGSINENNANGVNGTAVKYTAYINGCTITDCSAATDLGGAVYANTVTLIFDECEVSANNVAGTTISSCTSTKDGGAIYHDNKSAQSVFRATGLIVDSCSATANGEGDEHGGGALFTKAKTVTLTNSTLANCTTPKRGGGAYLSEATSVTLSGTVIQNCTAGKIGGGLIHPTSGNTRLVIERSSLRRSLIHGNIASGQTDEGYSGGGVFTNAYTVQLTDSDITNNQAAGSGGGLCHKKDANGSSYYTLIDGATITGNIAGLQGGGVYTLTNLKLKGLKSTTEEAGQETSVIHSQTLIQGNRLTTETAENAAGVYMKDSCTLTLEKSEGTPEGTLTAEINIKGNLTVDGKPSDLRLPESGGVNDNKVMVNSGVSGEVRVVNARNKLTRFGTAGSGNANPAGFTDAYQVFWSDDGSLYGIVDRQDATGVKIIWGADPICKITDGNGRPLYLDDEHIRPAVFDRLDDGTTNGTSTTSAFSTLRGLGTGNHFYYADGAEYTGSDFIVKMLVEEYKVDYLITAVGGAGRNVTLTTARTTDSIFPYSGREGTRCTILRTNNTANKALITAQTNLALENIVLDGGSESGIDANTNTRIISAITDGTKITLGRNATLQNAAVIGTTGNDNSVGKGGGVYLNNGAQLEIRSGSIRNCSAIYGGGVYIDSVKGAMTMTVGTITKCSAVNGGGVYFARGQLKVDGNETPIAGFIRLSGGSINRCTAVNGGGIYLNGGSASISGYANGRTRHMFMSGGNIASNEVTGQGGGIYLGDGQVRICFSGTPYVYSNTSENSLTDPDNAGKANNVEMGHTFSRTDNDPPTVLVSRGMNRGATVGVYVPEADHDYAQGSAEENSGSLYDRHGAENDPFATFEGADPRGLNYFVNDRNGMKGGQLQAPAANDKKIYWRIIYALSITKQVLSDDPKDETKPFVFTVKLTDPNNNDEPANINGQYGDLYFTNGEATFSLSSNDRLTKSAELLPFGLDYTIEEKLSPDDERHFKTNVENWNGQVTQGRIVTGSMNEPSHYTYEITFSNMHAVCKITDEEGRLLYKKNVDNTYSPAVYSQLVTAFNNVSANEAIEWHYKDEDGDAAVYRDTTPKALTIEMLVPEYEMEGSVSLLLGQSVTLTTARKDAQDGFPYVGGSTAAKIIRDFAGDTMISVGGLVGGDLSQTYADQMTSGDLILENIILDGGIEKGFSATVDGGILKVTADSSLTVGTGVTLQNARTSAHGAGVYLEEGSLLYISGQPAFLNNTVPYGNTADKNGDEAVYSGGYARQDIYIAGYANANAASLVVTGDITAAPGSIWVWAEQELHYKQGKQFARLKDGRTYAGVNAFRNGWPDRITGNKAKGDPKYVYGVVRGGAVYWSGTVNLTVSKTVDGDFADDSLTFTFTVWGLTPNDVYSFHRYTSTDGIVWTEDTSGDLSADANGEITFQLMQHEKIEISIPAGTEVTVRESIPLIANYTASYAMDDAAATEDNETTFTLETDTTVAFTNSFPAVGPTGVTFRMAPFVLMAVMGLLLVPVMTPRRRRRRHED